MPGSVEELSHSFSIQSLRCYYGCHISTVSLIHAGSAYCCRHHPCKFVHMNGDFGLKVTEPKCQRDKFELFSTFRLSQKVIVWFLSFNPV